MYCDRLHLRVLLRVPLVTCCDRLLLLVLLRVPRLMYCDRLLLVLLRVPLVMYCDRLLPLMPLRVPLVPIRGGHRLVRLERSRCGGQRLIRLERSRCSHFPRLAQRCLPRLLLLGRRRRRLLQGRQLLSRPCGRRLQRYRLHARKQHRGLRGGLQGIALLGGRAHDIYGECTFLLRTVGVKALKGPVELGHCILEPARTQRDRGQNQSKRKQHGLDASRRPATASREHPRSRVPPCFALLVSSLQKKEEYRVFVW